jgi:SAM-dependent methyltransferase
MAAAANVYQSARLARGYAYDRPPVHREIVAKLREHLQLTRRLPRALDIGCGAGLSTAALEAVAEYVIGIEPMAPMLQYRAAVTPTAQFAVACAEQLPFAAESFDLLAAAGSLNYANPATFLPEAKRVLNRHGIFAIYDFSAGRRLRDDPRLEHWYAAFQERYPAPPGYALDVRALPYVLYGLRLCGYHELEIAVPLTFPTYLRYVLSETCVEQAIASGQSEAEIEAWCHTTLSGILGNNPTDVLFDAYIAYVDCEEL